jgi:hypothetical protein
MGRTNTIPLATNNAGTAVGISEKITAGINLGFRAVRWDADGTAAMELANLGTNVNGVTVMNARSVNNSGVAVGEADKYVAGSNLGARAVRWDASGAATELDNLGTQADGTARGYSHQLCRRDRRRCNSIYRRE